MCSTMTTNQFMGQTLERPKGKHYSGTGRRRAASGSWPAGGGIRGGLLSCSVVCYGVVVAAVN